MDDAGDLFDDVASLRKAIHLINGLTKELDIHAAMDSVRHVALELLGCEMVTLFLVIESRRELRGHLGPPGAGHTVTIKFGEGIAGVVAQNGGLMNLSDAPSHPLFKPSLDHVMGCTTRNILCTAIQDMSGKNIAVVQAVNKQSGPFTSADEQHMQLFAIHLGNALVKARFFKEAKREKERLVTLSKCFKRLSAVTSLSGALDTIAAAVRELVCAQHVVVLLMDSARQVLWTRITNRHTHGTAALVRVQQGDGLVGACAANKKQLALCIGADWEPDPTLLQLHRLLEGRARPLSDVLLQPALDPHTDNVTAVLCVLNKADTAAGRDMFLEPTFTPSDCEALNVFSMEVADVLSARAVEVSFASALSVVTSTNGAAAGSSTENTVLGAAAAAVPCSSSSSASGQHRSTPLDQLSNVLTSQLLDYAPASMGAEERQPSMHYLARLQHSYTINVTGGSADGHDIGGLLDAAVERALQETHSEQLSSSAVLRRFSSTSAASRAASCILGSPGTGPLSPSCRSFHHFMPELSGLSSATSNSRRSELSTWDLDCTVLSKEQLVRLAYDIFMLSGVLEELGVPEAELSGFLSAVSSHYHSPADVPYHNLAHVVQVLHTVWLLLESTSARAVLSPEEELVLLIAAICHDLDHDGFTNSYHIFSQSPLGQRYNDKSVQENHHCALTFAVLSKRGSNLLCKFQSRDEFFAARKLLIDAILATDMHHHFTLTQELISHSTVFQAEEDTDRALLVKAFLHAADISNHVRPFPVALAHAERVQAEFRRQVARERALGLPVSPHMDAPEQTAYKMEVQFIDYVAGPLWERLGQIFPTLQEPLQNMAANRARFAALATSCHELQGLDKQPCAAESLTPQPTAAVGHGSATSTASSSSAARAEGCGQDVSSATPTSTLSAATASAAEDATLVGTRRSPRPLLVER